MQSTWRAAWCCVREFAAWLGLVPRQNSTGGKVRLGGISKRGDSSEVNRDRAATTPGRAMVSPHIS